MHPQRWVLVAALAVATGYLWLGGAFVGITSIEAGQSTLVTPALKAGQAVATFASGCFWCTESDFDKLPGVISTTSGYTGGNVANPTYKEVSSGRTGHAEAVQVVYDPAIVTYDKLLDHYWHNVDPFVANRQFCDVGTQYRPVIFFHTEEQRTAAESSKARIQMMFKQPIVVAIAQAGPFYRAEDYHQDYWKKNPVRYKFYRYNSGRDQYLEKIWGKDEHMKTASMKASPVQVEKTGDPWATFKKPSEGVLKKELTPLQYKVTQEEGTEPAFNNAYWDNHKEGIYVDIVSGEPLFSSLDKYESGTGWPSFTKPLEPGNIVTKEDRSWYLAARTEVRSKHANSHLGHVFKDGPKPTGLRYCMNSAAFRFIAKEDLVKEGYGKYVTLFEAKTHEHAGAGR